MGSRVMLDSSVVIALLNPEDPNNEVCFSAIQSRNTIFQISTLSLTECLIAPFRVSSQRASERYQEILHLVDEVVDVNSSISLKAAQLRARKGARLGDAVIAASAIESGSQLWTCDVKQSKQIANAKLLQKE